MTSNRKMNKPIQYDVPRLPMLSIVVDDFDSTKNASIKKDIEDKENKEVIGYGEEKESDTASIKKLLEDAEHKKQAFWELLDEHTAVIEKLKKIEKKEPLTPSASVKVCSKKVNTDRKRPIST